MPAQTMNARDAHIVEARDLGVEGLGGDRGFLATKRSLVPAQTTAMLPCGDAFAGDWRRATVRAEAVWIALGCCSRRAAAI